MKRIFLLLFIFLLAVPGVLAEDDDIEVFGLELEELLSFGSALLATVLFVLTALACKRTGRKRLAYVSLAFLLFALKNYLIASELLFDDFAWLDPVISVLEFGILLSFFIGVMKK